MPHESGFRDVNGFNLIRVIGSKATNSGADSYGGIRGSGNGIDTNYFSLLDD